jgi:hypothetical protein
MPKNPRELSATRRTSLLFAAMGLVVMVGLSLVAVQSGAIEGLNQSGVLDR